MYKVILYLSALVSICFAQQRYFNFQNFTTEDGLPGNTINCIYQDRTGLIWIGTDNGLSRYDGYRFENFPSPGDSTHSLRGLKVFSIYEHESLPGKLLIGADKALNLYDLSKNSFTNYSVKSKSKNVKIKTMVIDSTGLVWIGSNAGLISYNLHSHKSRLYFANESDPDSLSSNNIKKLFFDSHNQLWLGTANGFLKFDMCKQKFKRFLYHKKSMKRELIYDIKEDDRNNLWLASNRGLIKFQNESEKVSLYKQSLDNANYSSRINVLYSLQIDRIGTIWLATSGGGLSRFVPHTETFQNYFPEVEKLNSLKSADISYIYEDRSNVLWVGTKSSGLSKFKRNQTEFINYKNDPLNVQTLSHGRVSAFYEDQNKNIWIGLTKGKLDKLDKEHNIYSHFNLKPAPYYESIAKSIKGIVKDKDQNLWIATLGQGLIRYNLITNKAFNYRFNPNDNSTLRTDKILSLLIDKEGILWVGSVSKGISRYDQKTDKFHHYFYHTRRTTTALTFYEDDQGDIWVGTSKAGILKYNRNTDAFNCIIEPKQGNYEFRSIRSIYKRGDYLWLATSNGLVKYDIQNNTFKVFSKKDNLPEKGIRAIVADENDFLWVATGNGLSSLDIKTNNIVKYNLQSGIENIRFVMGSHYKDSGGEIYFGNSSGFVRFKPNESRVSPIPQMVFTDVNIFSESSLETPLIAARSIAADTLFELGYGKYAFLLEFSVLDYTKPSQNHYRYKLEGAENKWHELDNRRTLSFINLPPGNYSLKVQGCNSRGVWNKQGLAMHFKIAPPFWQRWWFILLSIVVLISLAITVFQLRIRSITKRNRELQEINIKLNSQIEVRKSIERSLRASESKYRTLIESIDESVYSLTYDGQFLYLNQTAAKRIGGKPSDIVNHFIHEYLPKKKSIKHLSGIREVINSAIGKVIDTSLEIDGRMHYYNLSIQPVIDDSGKISQALVIGVETTARVELEEQLRQSQKMEAIGRLAGGIAHDFNNFLTIIRGFSSILLTDIAKDDPAFESVREIDEASEKAQHLTQHLLAFSRKQVTRPKVLQLNKQIKKMHKMLQRLIGGHIRFKTILQKDLNNIFADPGQIEQILMNLVVNAGDAMPNGGELIIETKNIQSDGNIDLLVTLPKASSYVRIMVKDTGTGIEKKNLKKIFEPFFTTKAEGEGTGLGLSTVFGIVKQNDGYIWVDSEQNRGAAFFIYFLAIDQKDFPVGEKSEKKENLRGSENILIVENERGVRSMISRTLKIYGYRVFEAANAGEALEIYNTEQGSIDLVLTDVVMPGLSGVDLVERLYKEDENVKVIYMSGYTKGKIEKTSNLPSGTHFIQKPFTSQTITKKIRQALD